MQSEFPSHLENLGDIAQITDLKASDIQFLKKASQIYDVSLGQKYIPLEDLVRYSKNPESYILLGSHIDQALLGVSLSYPLDTKTADEINEAFVKNNISIILPKYSVGVIKSIAVDPAYRHRGIGTRLAIESMERLRKMSCSVFTAISWDSGRPDSSPKMFEKLGFQNVLEVKDYWFEDSIREGYQCPICGNPCHCNAIFFIKKET